MKQTLKYAKDQSNRKEFDNLLDWKKESQINKR
jgi:hypothetical protein